MEAQKRPQDIRIRNVSLYRRGKAETGTLYLTAHHLIFSYHPRDPRSRNVSSQLSSAATSSSNLTADATQTSSTPAAQPKSAKPQPKEIYVPYPIINHCTLRSVAGVNVPRTQNDPPQEYPSSEEIFPPTLGTSSYNRASTDSNRSVYGPSLITAAVSRSAALRIRCKDFAIFALHFTTTNPEKPAEEVAREVFYAIRDRTCVTSMRSMYAFAFVPPPQETQTGGHIYDARKEFARMGIRAKAPEGPGSAWRISDINHDYSYSPTYPSILAVPQQISDNTLKYGGSFRSKARIPALTYLHPNGGSISRSSQPFVGIMSKRNAQDEALVQAIFSSHTPESRSPGDSPPGLKPAASSTSLNGEDLTTLSQHAEEEESKAVRKRIYGSTRRNVIVDARPVANMHANKLSGGGIEDIKHYAAPGMALVDKLYLSIANIHVMRASAEYVVSALGNSDYLELAPDQNLLRKSKWMSHIAGILDGAEMVARVVGLGGSHALIHCSDGWDRTSQVAAAAQVMLDPHYRTIDGFITLVQKDFLSFGHKFAHRQGTEGSEKWFLIDGERPIPLRANGTSENNLQAIGQKALSNARSWLEKQKQNKIFGSSPNAKDGSDTSRPATPPPNPVQHSAPTPPGREEKHKMDENEVAPIFHQFLDAIFQLLHEEPNAFEFNEKFLRRLLYQSYAGQYGEFLFNCEKDRAQFQLPSVWSHLLARKQEFINTKYQPDTFNMLIFPRRKGTGPEEINTRWWAACFGRQDEEMNIPPPPVFQIPSDYLSTLSVAETSNGDADRAKDHGRSQAGIATAEPAEETMHGTPSQAPKDITAHDVVVVPIVSRDRAASVASDSMSIDSNTVMVSPVNSLKNARLPSIAAMQTESDPLGASAPQTSTGLSFRGGLDFAAFAQQNAFSER